jgi:hypothetical protein
VLTAAFFERQHQQQQPQHLEMESSNRASELTSRALLAAAPVELQQQQPQPANPLCVATVNYGAGVGDVSNEHVSGGPVFFGNVNVAMLQKATQVCASSNLSGSHI